MKKQQLPAVVSCMIIILIKKINYCRNQKFDFTCDDEKNKPTLAKFHDGK